MSDEDQTEATEAPKRGPGRPPKSEPTVAMVILRDYWTKGDGSPDDRVRAGTRVEVGVDSAMAGLESGTMRRATDKDE